jgi:hypothetical protein
MNQLSILWYLSSVNYLTGLLLIKKLLRPTNHSCSPVEPRVSCGSPWLGDSQADTQAFGSRASRRRRRTSPRLCGLWAMEARWISALVGGRAPPPVLRASFFVLGSRFVEAMFRWWWRRLVQ